MLRTIASRVFSGFLSGLGFSLAVLAVFAFTVWQEERWSDGFSYRQFDESVELTVENPRFNMWEGELLVFGAVANATDLSWRNLQLEAEFFDGNDRFVDECSGRIDRVLRPGQKEHFKLSCGRCVTDPAAYENMVIKVIEGLGVE